MTEEDLDSESLVFRHIDRVMRTASLDLESYGSDGAKQVRSLDKDVWSHRVKFACEFFHAFLKPSMDEEKHSNVLSNAYDKVDGIDGSFDRVRFGKEIFQEDIQHLHKENMVFQKSSELLIEDKSGDAKVEPENSDVKEEVIE